LRSPEQQRCVGFSLVFCILLREDHIGAGYLDRLQKVLIVPDPASDRHIGLRGQYPTKDVAQHLGDSGKKNTKSLQKHLFPKSKIEDAAARRNEPLGGEMV
jgi:hypothetical protein